MATIHILYMGGRDPMYAPMGGALPPTLPPTPTNIDGGGSKRRIRTENRPPAEAYGAYTLDLKTGVGQLTVGSNPTPSAIANS